MASKSEKTEKEGKVEARLSGRQFKDLSNQLEKLFKLSSADQREVLKDVIDQVKDFSESLSNTIENQSLNALSAIKAAEESLKRSDSTTADLLAQVSSLRDYVAKQQNLVKRYQDGYDWTVLKNFTQRIIRCIDDAEKRKNATSLSDAHRQDLEIICDQLVFALDGSGIEQFVPGTGISYAGQEKIAEVVGKDPLDHGGKPGYISQVISPGYYYYISDEQKKLIRPAKVRLFEKQPEGSDEVE
jgi:molecular chaperone GrpE (heat shock protein)